MNLANVLAYFSTAEFLFDAAVGIGFYLAVTKLIGPVSVSGTAGLLARFEAAKASAIAELAEIKAAAELAKNEAVKTVAEVEAQVPASKPIFTKLAELATPKAETVILPVSPVPSLVIETAAPAAPVAPVTDSVAAPVALPLELPSVVPPSQPLPQVSADLAVQIRGLSGAPPVLVAPVAGFSPFDQSHADAPTPGDLPLLNSPVAAAVGGVVAPAFAPQLTPTPAAPAAPVTVLPAAVPVPPATSPVA